MAVEIGVLRALLSLDSAAFESGAKRARSSMTGLQKATQTTGRVVAKAGRAMAIGFAAVAGAASVGAVAASRSIQELGNQARIAGLSAQEFKVLSLAAREFGVSQEQLSDILKDVNDKLGDYLATGAGPLADFFENIAPKVGITQEAFEGLSSSDALQLYVSSLEKANLSQAEMTFYLEAIANDATALIPLFRQNGAAIDDMAKRAAELGLTLNDDVVAAAGKARSEFGVVAEVLKTRLAAAFVEILPALTELAEAALPVVIELLNVLRPLITGIAQVLSGDFVGAWHSAKEAVMVAVDIIVSVVRNLGPQVLEALRALGARMVEGLRDAGRQAVEAAKQVGKDIISGLTFGIFDNIGKAEVAAGSSVRAASRAARKAAKIQSPSRVFMEIGQQLMQGLGLGIENNANIAATAAANAANDVAAAFDSNLIDTELGRTETALEGVANAISDTLFEGKSLRDGLREVWQGISSDLLQSGIAGLGSVIFGGGSSTSGGFFKNLFAGFFDGGGFIPRGQFGLVGERGPEFVTGPAMVTSRRQTSRMMQGGGITLNLRTDPGVIVEIAENTAGAMIQQNNNARDTTFNQRSRTAANDRKLR